MAFLSEQTSYQVTYVLQSTSRTQPYFVDYYITEYESTGTTGDFYIGVNEQLEVPVSSLGQQEQLGTLFIYGLLVFFVKLAISNSLYCFPLLDVLLGQ